MTLAAPRLRSFSFHIGQDVRLRGFQATVTRRLRTATGRAMYAVQLAGEPAYRHVLEEAIDAAEQMQVAA
ncbi:MAG: hypothetical protein LCH99_26420 [Proteobacteria bacterium]|nr:hypothetical protein [Pseudomonadota bacterium]